MISFLPHSTKGGVTTAQNATAEATSGHLVLTGGPHLLISVGANPMYIRFGTANTAAVSSTNGLRLPANTVVQISKPEQATDLIHIRDGSTDADFSVQGGIAGT